MIFLSARVFYFALSLVPNNLSEPLIGWDQQPLTRAECLRIERKTSGTWCHAVRVPKRFVSPRH